MNLAFDRTILLKYKHIHVVLVATDEQEEQLKHELLVTGLAIDVKPYEYIQHSDNQSRNGIIIIFFMNIQTSMNSFTYRYCSN